MSLFTAIRWQQRLVNLRRASALLTQSVSQNSYNELEKSGLIQQFEFCFELSWKTLKDYLVNEGLSADTPRDVIKQAFSTGLLPDANVWIDALEKRNMLSHAYKEETAQLAITLIKDKYYPSTQHLVTFFNEKALSASYGLDLSSLLQILLQLAKYPRIEEVLLFGSRAMGNFKSTSDIDICIKGSISENDLASINTALDDNISPYKIDLLLFNAVEDPAVIEHIQSFGKHLYP